MKKLALLIALLSWPGSSVRSQPSTEDAPELYYDIFIRDSCLATWIDLSPILNAQVWDRLRDGVDVAIECRIDLTTPRWLWSDHLEMEQVRTIRLSYRQVSGDFVLDPGDAGAVRSLVDSEAIAFYLSDSAEVCIRRLSEVDPDKTLKLTFKITSIFLTDLNLADRIASGDGSNSPVKYLFRQFLELTDYGRRQYSVRSRPFTLGELPRTP